MGQESASNRILKVKYSFGPYFWIGACLFAVYYLIKTNDQLWDLLAIFGLLLMLFDRVLCRFKRMKIYEDHTDTLPVMSEVVELEFSIPPKFQIFDRQRGIFFGCVVVGFYISYLFWFFVVKDELFYQTIGFYFWGVGSALLLYQREAPDIYRWKRVFRRSKGQEIMMTNRAVYICAGFINFTGHISQLKKKFILTSSGHIMILWQDIQAWMLIQRPIFFIGPSFYSHVIKLIDGRTICIDREIFLDRENEILHGARRHTKVLVEEKHSLWQRN